MKKVDFISKSEKWLVSEDILDPRHQLEPSTMVKVNINDYIRTVRSTLKNKAPDLLPKFNKMIKESKVRGVER